MYRVNKIDRIDCSSKSRNETRFLKKKTPEANESPEQSRSQSPRAFWPAPRHDRKARGLWERGLSPEAI